MSDLTMGNKKIFLMDVDPFAHRTPDATVDEFIYEHELVEETEDNYLLMGVVYPGDVVRFPRELYRRYDTREEALIHLDRIALGMIQELEERTSKLQHLIDAIDVEFRKP
ncbi:hypothetical protein ELR74_18835 [Salmonella enterica subsp. enterica serovar Bareilly]|nr:hypothetical protein [Salmonella enterica subsp. enterica serovar Bareilly]